jgi:hypothetical protein
MVSSKLTGEMVAMMVVLVRPPRESWRRRVSLDSLWLRVECQPARGEGAERAKTNR